MRVDDVATDMKPGEASSGKCQWLKRKKEEAKLQVCMYKKKFKRCELA